MELVTAQFCDSYFPVMDGVANVTRNYAYWLNRTLGVCHVVVPHFPGSLPREDGIPLMRYTSVPFPGNHPYRVGFPIADVGFMRRLAAVPFDLVHVQSPLVSGALARWVARRRRIPLVASFHTKYRDDFKRVLRAELLVEQSTRWLVRFYESADSVWVPSRSTAESLRQYGYRGDTVVVENGTDLVPPRDPRAFRERANADLGIGDDLFVMLFIGQHVWEKNHRLLLDALRLLRNRQEDFLMVFVGSGYAAEAMRERASAVGMDRAIRFIGPVTDRERIKQFYARADLFLFPSLYDTSPLTIREAAAFRVPTVFVDGATATEGIEQARNGFLAPGIPEGYADTLARLKEQPQLIRDAGDGAHRTLYRTWEQVTREVAGHYLRILGRLGDTGVAAPQRVG